MTQLAPRAMWLFYGRFLISFLVVWLPASLAVGAGAGFAAGPLVGALAGGTLGFLAFVVVLWWPRLLFASWGYQLEADRLVVARGVWTRRVTAIPLVRVQHVDVARGPVEQALGLAEVYVYSASGLGADGVIPGLTLADAHALRDALIARSRREGQGDDGV